MPSLLQPLEMRAFKVSSAVSSMLESGSLWNKDRASPAAKSIEIVTAKSCILLEISSDNSFSWLAMMHVSFLT